MCTSCRAKRHPRELVSPEYLPLPPRCVTRSSPRPASAYENCPSLKLAWPEKQKVDDERDGCTDTPLPGLFHIDHQECAKRDQQRREETLEKWLPLEFGSRQPLRKTNPEARHRKAEMLRLYSLHDRGVMSTMHSRLMLVKKKQGRTCHREKRKNPSRPACPHNSARALQFQQAQTQKQDRENLVLHHLKMMAEAVIPTLRAKRPELGVAPNQNKETRKNETERPCESSRGPAVADIGFRQNEKPS